MTKDEERALMEEFIARDQALTPDERREDRRQDKLDMYRRQLERMLRMLNSDAPSLLLSLNAHNMYHVACSLWPDDMARHWTDDFHKEVRRRNKQCIICAADLPLPYGSEEFCANCNASFDKMKASFTDEPLPPACRDAGPEGGSPAGS